MLLEVKNLNKKFGSVTAANNINFKMNENEIIGVIGANGAGKTTFCNIITGYLKPDSGVILYEGKNITKLNVQEIKNIGIHRSFQIPQVFENLGVLENIIITELVAKNKQNALFEDAYSKKNYQNEKFDNWKVKWQKRLTKDSNKLMQQNNPIIIPRNHNVESVLKSAENNDLAPFNDLLQALKNPYTNLKILNKYCSPAQKTDEKYQTFCGT